MNRTSKNQKNNWRNKLHWRALFVLAIYVSFAAGARSLLPGTALAAPMQEAEPAAEEQAFQEQALQEEAFQEEAIQESGSGLAGMLSVVHGDPQEGSGEKAKLLFHLTDDAGKTTELKISEEVMEAAGGLMELQNRKVVVSIDESQKMFGDDAAQPVASIRLADETLTKAGPAAGDKAVTGTQRWISIACKFSDISAEPKNLAYFQGMYGSGVGRLNHFWREVSSNVMNINGSTAVNWRTLPRPRSFYITSSGANLTALFNDCTAVHNSGVYFPAFVGINMMFNANLDCCAWGGGRTASLDGVTKQYRVTWEPPWGYANAAVIAHEMGHGFGLPHANNWDKDGNPYDNPWDVMSAATGYAVTDSVYGKRGKHVNAYHKIILGWLPPAQRRVISANGTYNVTLDRLSLTSTSNYRTVIFPLSSTRYWVLESRKRTGAYESALAGDAVLVYEVNTNRTTSEKQPAWLFDADSPPANYSDNEGSMLKVGETFTHSASQLSVKVMSASANGFNLRIIKGPSTSAQVTQLWPVTGASSPGSAKLWARVKNTGTAALPASAKVQFYVTGPSWAGSHFVGTPAVGALAPGASKWVSFNWSISSSRPAGAYKYWAHTLSPNSAWKGPQNFTVAAGPKARILQTWPISGAATPGKARLYARVKNTGTVTLPSNAKVQYYVLGPSWAGTHYVGTASVSGLVAGATKWVYFDWNISSSRPAGAYQYYARAQTTIAISAWKGPQNFTVAAGPKAQVLQTWEVSGAFAPGKARLWARVKNIGTVTFPSSAKVQYYVTGPAWAGNHVVGTASVSGLAPGAIKWVFFDWNISASRRAGEYRYWAQAKTNIAISPWKGPQKFGVGINSQFNGSASPWGPHSGAWSISSSAYYYTPGINGKIASASYPNNFQHLDYTVKIWRNGSAAGNATRLYVRGTPAPLSSLGDWAKGYLFQISRDGKFSVYKKNGAAYTALRSWVASSRINRGSAWNLLRVRAVGTSLKFYINGFLVWSGTDSTFASGRVGVGMYRSSGSTANGFWADNAKLSLLSSTGGVLKVMSGGPPGSMEKQQAELKLEQDMQEEFISDEQQALNDEADSMGELGTPEEAPASKLQLEQLEPSA